MGEKFYNFHTVFLYFILKKIPWNRRINQISCFILSDIVEYTAQNEIAQIYTTLTIFSQKLREINAFSKEAKKGK